MISPILVWNIRGVGNSSSRESLKRLVHKFKPLLVAISEPMLSANKAWKLGRYINLPKFVVNSSIDSKIWLFWHDSCNLEHISSSVQQVTLGLKSGSATIGYFSFVYASCSPVQRLDVFNELSSFAASISTPWVVGGDFNCVLRPSEKKGGCSSFSLYDRI